MEGKGLGELNARLWKASGRLLVLTGECLVAIGLALITFALAVVYGLAWILQRALPWALRLACIAVWVFGIYGAVQGTSTAFARMADAAGRTLLGAAAVILVVSIPVEMLRASPPRVSQRDALRVWAGFVFGGLLGIGILIAAGALAGIVALDPAIGVMPPIAAATLIVYLAIRVKRAARRDPQREEQDVGCEGAGKVDAA